jgi:hypothetical protein
LPRLPEIFDNASWFGTCGYTAAQCEAQWQTGWIGNLIFLLMDALWNDARFRKARLSRIRILIFNPQPGY